MLDIGGVLGHVLDDVPLQSGGDEGGPQALHPDRQRAVGQLHQQARAQADRDGVQPGHVGVWAYHSCGDAARLRAEGLPDRAGSYVRSNDIEPQLRL